jgi:hypothetical protein
MTVCREREMGRGAEVEEDVYTRCLFGVVINLASHLGAH